MLAHCPLSAGGTHPRESEPLRGAPRLVPVLPGSGWAFADPVYVMSDVAEDEYVNRIVQFCQEHSSEKVSVWAEEDPLARTRVVISDGSFSAGVSVVPPEHRNSKLAARTATRLLQEWASVKAQAEWELDEVSA